MILAGGRHAGRAVLSPASVKAMTSDRLTPAQRSDPRAETVLTEGRGWGYGLSVVSRAVPGGPGVGAIGWNGGLGTSWIGDAAKGLTAILMTQRAFEEIGRAHV